MSNQGHCLWISLRVHIWNLDLSIFHLLCSSLLAPAMFSQNVSPKLQTLKSGLFCVKSKTSHLSWYFWIIWLFRETLNKQLHSTSKKLREKFIWSWTLLCSALCSSHAIFAKCLNGAAVFEFSLHFPEQWILWAFSWSPPNNKEIKPKKTEYWISPFCFWPLSWKISLRDCFEIGVMSCFGKEKGPKMPF